MLAAVVRTLLIATAGNVRPSIQSFYPGRCLHAGAELGNIYWVG